jgi:uncharacterized membrane protein YqjE
MSEPSSDNAPGAAGAATGLFQSLRQLLATVIGLAHTRLELLTTELREEVQHAVGIVMWALVALITLMIGLMLGGLTIVFAYWDTHRVLAASLVTAAFVLLALLAVVVIAVKANSKPRFLDSTLTELGKDAQALSNKQA